MLKFLYYSHKISIINICYTNIAPMPTTFIFLYFMNEKFNKNAEVEKFTKMLGIDVRTKGI